MKWVAWSSGGISPKLECIIGLLVALTLKLACFKWVVGLRSWIFKSDYDLDLKAFGRECCHSSTLSWAKFVGGTTNPYAVPAFRVWGLMHCYWSHPRATICCRKFCMHDFGWTGCLHKVVWGEAVEEIFMKRLYTEIIPFISLWDCVSIRRIFSSRLCYIYANICAFNFNFPVSTLYSILTVWMQYITLGHILQAQLVL